VVPLALAMAFGAVGNSKDEAAAPAEDEAISSGRDFDFTNICINFFFKYLYTLCQINCQYSKNK
jgi:hypothetical protein